MIENRATREGPWDLLLLGRICLFGLLISIFYERGSGGEEEDGKDDWTCTWAGASLACSSLISARRTDKAKRDFLTCCCPRMHFGCVIVALLTHSFGRTATWEKRLLIIASGKLVDYIFFFSPSSVRSVVGAHWEGRTNFALCRTKFWFHLFHQRAHRIAYLKLMFKATWILILCGS